MRKGTRLKPMAQNMLFCFANISAEILLHVLGYIYCAEKNILANFCRMLLPLKASINYLR
jgi:hypothetical protein